MTKVVFKKLSTKRKSSRKLLVKRLRDSGGRVRTIAIVDTESETLPRDLESVFARNVLKARKANKQALSSTR